MEKTIPLAEGNFFGQGGCILARNIPGTCCTAAVEWEECIPPPRSRPAPLRDGTDSCLSSEPRAVRPG